MENKFISSYISGLTNMASSCSNEIGPSYISADCFNKKNFKKEFSKYYKIPIECIKIEESKKTLEQVFSEWLGKKGDDIIENLLYWIKLCVGEPIKTFDLSEDSNLINILSRCDNGISEFYFVEDVFFVEYKEYMVCFIIGNNE